MKASEWFSIVYKDCDYETCTAKTACMAEVGSFIITPGSDINFTVEDAKTYIPKGTKVTGLKSFFTKIKKTVSAK